MESLNSHELGAFEIGEKTEGDPYLHFALAAPHLGELALNAMENESASYRVKVGSTLMGYNTASDTVVNIPTANIKLLPEMPKYCAEMFAIDNLKDLNRQLIEFSMQSGVYLGQFEPIGAVNVSTGDKEVIKSITDSDLDALCMCSDCVDYYSEQGVDDGFINLSMTDELNFLQAHTLGDLKSMYRGTSPSTNTLLRLVRPEKWREEIKASRVFSDLDTANSVQNHLTVKKAILGLA